MVFEVGDMAVVPAQGVGIVKDIEEIDFGEFVARFYVFKILDKGLTFKCPVDGVEENRVRKIMDVSEIDAVYEVLADRDKPADKQTWNRRYREYMNKIKTGDPMEVAGVLRDLAVLRLGKALSFGERKMYDQAFDLLVQEIAVARDVDEQIIKDEIEVLFAKADAAAEQKQEGGGKKKKSKKKKAAEE